MATAMPSYAMLVEFDRLTARALLEATPSPAIVLDEATNVVAHNARADEFLQTHTTLVVGKAIDGPFGVVAARVRRTAGMGTATIFEQTLDNAWYRITAFPLQTRADGPALQVIVAADITQQKHAEYEIRESEARLEEATRIAQLGTYKLYWDTGAVQWSPHMYVMHGLSPSSYVHTCASSKHLGQIGA